ncbi:MAG: Rrf2 family transcriptional regulator [Rhodospirillales bacterium]
MRLKSSTDFGLRALMILAGQPAQDYSTNDMARELGISRHHLIKIVQTLSAAGIVATRRGAGGGFALARPAGDITLGEAVRALEAGQALVECFRADGGACNLMPACRLKGRLAAAREAFLDELDGTTLADCAYTPPAARNGAEATSRQ